MSIKLTDSEKLERKLMRMFERHFRNYFLDFTKTQVTNSYLNERTYDIFSAYVAGYNKGKANRL